VNPPQASPRLVQLSFVWHWQIPPVSSLQTLGDVHDPQIRGWLQSSINVPQVKPSVAQARCGVHPH
jgi:hypothetical protein